MSAIFNISSLKLGLFGLIGWMELDAATGSEGGGCRRQDVYIICLSSLLPDKARLKNGENTE
jgi:hypothetical protein